MTPVRGVPPPVQTTSRDGVFRAALRAALPYPRKPIRLTPILAERAKRDALDYVVVSWKAGLLRCSLGGFYPDDVSRPGPRERAWLMDRFGHHPRETLSRRSYDNLTTMAIREYIVFVLSFDADLTEAVARVHPNYHKFASNVRMLMDAARKAFSRCTSRSTPEETLARIESELPRAMNLVQFAPPRPWFWEDAAGYFERLIFPTSVMKEFNIFALKTFDVRYAYDRNPNVALMEAELAGHSAFACEAVRAFASRQIPLLPHLADQAVIREAHTLCMFVRDCFRIRIVRAPRHWRFKLEEPIREFPACVKCRGLNESVLYDIHLDRFFCGNKKGCKKAARTNSLCDGATKCVHSEIVLLPLYGNLVEFFGRMVTLCSGCRTHPAFIREGDDDRFKTLCDPCREGADIERRSCERCGLAYPRIVKREWTRVRVFNEPNNRKELWFCPAEKNHWLQRHPRWSYPLLMRLLSDTRSGVR